MISQQTQIKLNLPVALRDFIASKAARYDLPVATYIKHLVMKDVDNLQYPIFEMSSRAEDIARKAIAKKREAIKVKNISTYFKKLSA